VPEVNLERWDGGRRDGEDKGRKRHDRDRARLIRACIERALDSRPTISRGRGRLNGSPVLETLAKESMGRRYVELHDEIADLDAMIGAIVDELAPALVARNAIGRECAAQLLLTDVGRGPLLACGSRSDATARAAMRPTAGGGHADVRFSSPARREVAVTFGLPRIASPRQSVAATARGA